MKKYLFLMALIGLFGSLVYTEDKVQIVANGTVGADAVAITNAEIEVSTVTVFQLISSGTIGVNTTSPSSAIEVVNGSITVKGSNMGLQVGVTNFVVQAGGNTGIGTSNPGGVLQVIGKTRLENTSTMPLELIVGSPYMDITRQSDGAYMGRMVNATLDSANILGIGGASGVALGGVSDNYGWWTTSQANYTNVTGSASAPAIAHALDFDTGILWPAANTLAFATNFNERLRFTSSGRVGIGTVSPGALVHISSPVNSGDNMLLVSTGSTKIFEVTSSSIVVGSSMNFTAGSNLLFNSYALFRSTLNNVNMDTVHVYIDTATIAAGATATLTPKCGVLVSPLFVNEYNSAAVAAGSVVF